MSKTKGSISKNFLRILLLAASLGLILGATLQQSAEELYEAALFTKDAHGDMEGAIKIFKEIVARFPENIKISARAQLQIGMCYEKLGLQEAPKAYQKVLDDFPEQKDAVKIAQEKLSILRKAQSAISKVDKDFNIRFRLRRSCPWMTGQKGKFSNNLRGFYFAEDKGAIIFPH